MTAELAERYYRLALSKATKRDLSGAVMLAGYACEFDENNKNAARLLELCLYELGRLDVEGDDNELPPVKNIRTPFRIAFFGKRNSGSAPMGKGSLSDREIIEKISFLAQGKQWHKAVHMARSIKHRNVRVLNIQGCLYACMRQYKLAACSFAQALEKDRGNKLAAHGLAEVTRRERFGRAYEKPL